MMVGSSSGTEAQGNAAQRVDVSALRSGEMKSSEMCVCVYVCVYGRRVIKLFQTLFQLSHSSLGGRW